ncbi:unnamed protein product [Rotaria sp. Silwood1]|nr:unnamed protein product [Rotaria sp. Silwood1]CAF3706542.1 unnamed protein product [Rotaria sp. Silwood1]CAF4591356.1 unnamed protein product [Rotaria sp. Silwood1]CAF4749251.1 unnamed protein product [Rotaria sp. Silwood1]CAF4923950.1 unnamed protein product [Rotaria sp. Silwood1]
MRELELASIRRASLLRAVNMALFFAAMPLVGFSTYAGAWFTGRQLKAVDIFITLAFYTQMRVPVMYALPLAIEKLSELRLAWHRIDKFIQLTIKEERTLHTSDSDRYQQKGAITMCNASFSWNGHDDCLSSLNIDIEPGTFVGIAGVVGAGKSSLFAAVLGPAFWLLCRYYLRSSQQLKRMESITRSPIFGLFASSLNGLTTIRAFKVQNDMIRAFMNLADANTRPYLYTVGAARWFCLRIDVMTTLFTLFTALFVVILRNRANPAMLTLSLLYSINISAWFQFGVRQLTEAQNLMISVERIDEYARLPQEEDNGSSKRLIKTPTDWPDRGAIEFRNYSLRYRSNLEPTLKNINLAIKPCEKVGIIGRTGAGKSSLFQGLLRLVDRSIVDGEILIDDIDISRITLNHLRSHISVIPQQFVLFAGTLRSNIDPLDVYSDAQCWTALEAVQMKAMASNHPAGLLMPVTESGSNLSIGQCQLICLCRAILRPSRILLIDEATANIDNESDRKLQLIIADVAKNRTVLTIAHRLNTVTNSDRLLALDNGMVVDFDVPDKVLVRFQ